MVTRDVHVPQAEPRRRLTDTVVLYVQRCQQLGITTT